MLALRASNGFSGDGCLPSFVATKPRTVQPLEDYIHEMVEMAASGKVKTDVAQAMAGIGILIGLREIRDQLASIDDTLQRRRQ